MTIYRELDSPQVRVLYARGVIFGALPMKAMPKHALGYVDRERPLGLVRERVQLTARPKAFEVRREESSRVAKRA